MDIILLLTAIVALCAAIVELAKNITEYLVMRSKLPPNYPRGVLLRTILAVATIATVSSLIAISGINPFSKILGLLYRATNVRYRLVEKDMSWSQANEECLSMGGHLATITSAEEMESITAILEQADVNFVWLGGCTNSSGDYEWITKEQFLYSMWYEGEPSHVDKDGTAESYLEMYKIASTGEWAWNDERDNPTAAPSMAYRVGHTGYICEFDEYPLA